MAPRLDPRNRRIREESAATPQPSDPRGSVDLRERRLEAYRGDPKTLKRRCGAQEVRYVIDFYNGGQAAPPPRVRFAFQFALHARHGRLPDRLRGAARVDRRSPEDRTAVRRPRPPRGFVDWHQRHGTDDVVGPLSVGWSGWYATDGPDGPRRIVRMVRTDGPLVRRLAVARTVLLNR
eukprot:1182772-Prorocentrum_minimum.AAC.9